MNIGQTTRIAPCMLFIMIPIGIAVTDSQPVKAAIFLGAGLAFGLGGRDRAKEFINQLGRIP